MKRDAEGTEKSSSRTPSELFIHRGREEDTTRRLVCVFSPFYTRQPGPDPLKHTNIWTD